MVRLTREELEAYRGATVPDLLGPDLRLLFVGINPGLCTAAVQTHFAHPANRFYPALLKAGIITHRIAPSAGMTEADRTHLTSRGVGITNLVRRATARASEVTADELRDGVDHVRHLVQTHSPRVVAVAGISAYRLAFSRRTAVPGRQPEDTCGVPLWVVPNPSGLNAHETIASLADAYAEVATAAGIDLQPLLSPLPQTGQRVS